eukprot:403346182
MKNPETRKQLKQILEQQIKEKEIQKFDELQRKFEKSIGFKFESPSELEISHHASNPQQQSRYNMISGQVQTPVNQNSQFNQLPPRPNAYKTLQKSQYSNPINHTLNLSTLQNQQLQYQPLKNVPTLHNSQYPTGISTPNRGVSRNVGVYQKALDFIPKSQDILHSQQLPTIQNTMVNSRRNSLNGLNNLNSQSYLANVV